MVTKRLLHTWIPDHEDNPNSFSSLSLPWETMCLITVTKSDHRPTIACFSKHIAASKVSWLRRNFYQKKKLPYDCLFVPWFETEWSGRTRRWKKEISWLWTQAIWIRWILTGRCACGQWCENILWHKISMVQSFLIVISMLTSSRIVRYWYGSYICAGGVSLSGWRCRNQQ